MIGETISHYRILREIGRGGMGAVYEAEDLQLRRRIALKVLDGELADDDERRRRFAREARAVAAIRHPSIVTIFSVEEREDLAFLTMELVEGRMLSELIPDRGFDYPDWLAVARPLVDAVAAAHEVGITHRDLKPDNVMVGPNGLKVLDFGLAKMVDVDGLGQAGTRMRTRTMTTHGQIMGTATYMSPEQAEGRTVDLRSDVFSLGSLLFEMATGQAPFRGNSTVAILSSIIRDDPPTLTSFTRALPKQVGTVLEKCLAKDVDSRWPSARDLRAQIFDLPGEPAKTLPSTRKDNAESRPTTSSSVRSLARMFRRRLRRLIWISVAAVAVAIAAIAWALLRPAPEPLEMRAIVPLAVEGSLSTSPAWSPDGQWIVFASNRSGSMDLWRRSLVTLETQRLTDSSHSEAEPAWSPDGENIAFSSDRDGGGLFVMRADGGEPHRVTSFGNRPSWSPDNRMLAFEWYGRVYVTRVGGGEPRMLFYTDGFPRPTFSPDGTRVVFWSQLRQDVCSGSLEGEDLACLGVLTPGEEVSGLAWSRDGSTLVVSKGSFGGSKDLWQVPVRSDGTGTLGKMARLSASPFHDVDAALSFEDRQIAYSLQRVERQLWLYELDPQTGLAATAAPIRLAAAGQNSVYPALSADARQIAWTGQTYARGALFSMDLDGGSTAEVRKLTSEVDLQVREVHAAFSQAGEIVYSSVRGGSYEIWRLASARAPLLQITDTEPGVSDASPSWSPDGRSIAFQSSRDGESDIWTVSANEAGWSDPVRRTALDGVSVRSPVWSPDGRWIAYRHTGDSPDIWLLDTQTWETKPFEAHPADEFWSAWSDDGSRLYFTSNRGGAFNVWVKPIHGDSEAVQVTSFRRSDETGLSATNLYTRFDIGGDRMVLTLETRRAEVYVMETQ